MLWMLPPELRGRNHLCYYWNGRRLEQPQLLSEPGCLALLGNLGRKNLVRDITKNKMLTQVEHKRSCVAGLKTQLWLTVESSSSLKKKYLKAPDIFWVKNILWSEGTKFWTFWHHLWRKPGTAHHLTNTPPVVKHRNGGVFLAVGQGSGKAEWSKCLMKIWSSVHWTGWNVHLSTRQWFWHTAKTMPNQTSLERPENVPVQTDRLVTI